MRQRRNEIALEGSSVDAERMRRRRTRYGLERERARNRERMRIQRAHEDEVHVEERRIVNREAL